jgi:hypothetical protein
MPIAAFWIVTRWLAEPVPGTGVGDFGLLLLRKLLLARARERITICRIGLRNPFLGHRVSSLSHFNPITPY